MNKSNVIPSNVDFWSSQRAVDGIGGIQKTDNRFDLRGISFPKEYADYNYKGKRLLEV